MSDDDGDSAVPCVLWNVGRNSLIHVGLYWICVGGTHLGFAIQNSLPPFFVLRKRDCRFLIAASAAQIFAVRGLSFIPDPAYIRELRTVV